MNTAPLRGYQSEKRKTKFHQNSLEMNFVTITSENSYSNDNFETKLQTKFSKPDKSFEQQQE